MYTPRHFALDDPAVLRALMREHPFATLVVAGDPDPEIAHVPATLVRRSTDSDEILLHLARGNPMVSAIARHGRGTAVFHAPHHYVSPDFYVSDGGVPTWNYVVVHARGPIVELDDDGLQEVLDALSAHAESQLDKRPWTTAKMDPEAYRRMRRAIVGYRLRIETLEGKAKLSQNRSDPDREAAAAGVATDPHPDAQSVARWMRQQHVDVPGSSGGN